MLRIKWILQCHLGSCDCKLVLERVAHEVAWGMVRQQSLHLWRVEEVEDGAMYETNTQRVVD